MHHVRTKGVGVFPVVLSEKCEQAAREITEFAWKNDWFFASVLADGSVRIGKQVNGRFSLYADEGDTYSDLIGEAEVPLVCAGLRLVETSSVHAVVEADFAGDIDGASVTAKARILFDQSPLVRWDVELKSRGTGFCVMAHFDFAESGQVLAGMPFDMVPRAAEDTDLLPMTVDAALAKILLGQRELDVTRTFPFQNHVGIACGDRINAVLARGVYAYRASQQGGLSLLLRRSVEWLTRTNLAGRSGDAGPVMYVPDARCERTVTHSFACLGTALAELPRWSDLYRNEPLIAGTVSSGTKTEESLLREPLPLSALLSAGDHVQARFFNPHPHAVQLSQPRSVVASKVSPLRSAETVRPKEILTCRLNTHSRPAESGALATVVLLNPPQWRCGANEGRVDPQVVEEMKRKKAALETELARLRAATPGAGHKHRQKHAALIVEREILELEISIVLNEQKASRSGMPLAESTFHEDPQVREIGIRLNELRRVRRIFDYVVGVPLTDTDA
jgi:alpha-mannosidase